MATKTKQRKPDVEATISRSQLMVSGSDGAFRQFVHDMLAFSARLQAVRDQLGGLIGLSGTQYTVLIAIAHLSGMGGKIGVNKVAEHLHFSGAFMTIEVNKLVASELVKKQTDSEDRRRVVLRITSKARALLNELAPVQRPANDRLFGCLSSSDFARIRKLISKMVDTADDVLRTMKNSPATAAKRQKQLGRPAER
ncbi:MAG TPA: MarR family winged helix-turn-helix transcriptional regulator [Steroidobacteraceae bacterium]|nr:MarR family winged helix-turn-helix transcriptional regulator [Steroidobacteraceae bacterium]